MARRYDHHRKQQIYSAILAENRAPADGVIRKREISVPPAPLSQRVDDRDPVEIARAASAALKGAP